MTSAAVIIEALGNLMALIAVVAFLFKSNAPGLISGLRPGLLALGLFCATNIFYAVAYFGRTTERFEWWDTSAEQLIRAIQISTFYIVPISMIAAARYILKGEPDASGQ